MYYRAVALSCGVVIAMLAGGSGVVGQEVQVVAVIDAYHAALADGDSVTALGHLAPDVIILESGGVEDKERFAPTRK